uniref:Cathepsin L-like proteinase n=1 Tax=Aceria tosichella TaxID=561515 RepID=A0A6G1SHR5_9ACAR
MMEYLYCKRHGQLVAFSEQYMVDCGADFLDGMNGCDGNDAIESVPKFIRNFGMELAQHYPYQMSQTQCPYSNSMNLDTTGFIRMDFGAWLQVPIESWPDLLAESPLFVLMGVGPDFAQYGGGVVDGTGCPEIVNHAMVIVGHGRQDGQEYWLMRNSHGTDWGEKGHYKLSKAAPKRCIFHQVAFAFGTIDGKNFAHLGKNINNFKVINWDQQEMFKMLMSQQQQIDEQKSVQKRLLKQQRRQKNQLQTLQQIVDQLVEASLKQQQQQQKKPHQKQKQKQPQGAMIESARKEEPK